MLGLGIHGYILKSVPEGASLVATQLKSQVLMETYAFTENSRSSVWTIHKYTKGDKTTVYAKGNGQQLPEPIQKVKLTDVDLEKEPERHHEYSQLIEIKQLLGH